MVPELLAPVQDWDSLKMVKDLADAIYLGIENYNMRMNAKNFKRENLKELVDYCNNHNPEMKVYLCTNILIYDNELDDLDKLI